MALKVGNGLPIKPHQSHSGVSTESNGSFSMSKVRTREEGNATNEDYL